MEEKIKELSLRKESARVAEIQMSVTNQLMSETCCFHNVPPYDTHVPILRPVGVVVTAHLVAKLCMLQSCPTRLTPSLPTCMLVLMSLPVQQETSKWARLARQHPPTGEYFFSRSPCFVLLQVGVYSLWYTGQV